MPRSSDPIAKNDRNSASRLVWFSAAVTVLLALLAPSPAASATAISLGELQSLLLIGQDDEAIASALRTRGAGFEVTRDLLSDLRRKGAGRATLAALSTYLAPPVLLVSGVPPGSELLVGDQPVKSVPTTAGLKVTGLTEGAHRITVRSAGYQDLEKQIQVRAGETTHLELKLREKPAILVVAESRRNLTVEVDGKAARDRRLELSPGPHELEFSCPVCQRRSQTIILRPGEEQVIDPVLEIDPEAVRALRLTMTSALERGDSSAATSAATSLLEHLPDDLEVVVTAAQGFFLEDDKASFVAAALRALARGGELRLPVRHRDTLMESSLEDSFLLLTARSIGFEPLDADCAIGALSFEAETLTHYSVTREGGYLWLELGFRRPGKRKADSLRLTDRGSELTPASKQKSLAGLINVQYRGHVMTTRNRAQESLEAIRALLSRIPVELHTAAATASGEAP